MTFCIRCGHELEEGSKYCKMCGTPVDAEWPETKQRNEEKVKNDVVSLILSFVFPGLGHIYLGDKKRGTMFLVATLVVTVVTVMVISAIMGSRDPPLGLMGGVFALTMLNLILRLAAIIDGMDRANKYNHAISEGRDPPW